MASAVARAASLAAEFEALTVPVSRPVAATRPRQLRARSKAAATRPRRSVALRGLTEEV